MLIGVPIVTNRAFPLLPTGRSHCYQQGVPIVTNCYRAFPLLPTGRSHCYQQGVPIVTNRAFPLLPTGRSHCYQQGVPIVTNRAFPLLPTGRSHCYQQGVPIVTNRAFPLLPTGRSHCYQQGVPIVKLVLLVNVVIPFSYLGSYLFYSSIYQLRDKPPMCIMFLADVPSTVELCNAKNKAGAMIYIRFYFNI